MNYARPGTNQCWISRSCLPCWGLVAAVVLLSVPWQRHGPKSSASLLLYSQAYWVYLARWDSSERSTGGMWVTRTGGRIRWCLLFIRAGTACLLSLFSFVLRYSPK